MTDGVVVMFAWLELLALLTLLWYVVLRRPPAD